MPRVMRVTIRTVAEITLTCGAVLLLFAFYLLVWTNHQTSLAQNHLLSSFRASAERDSTTSTTPRPSAGDGVAVLHIPRLGRDWEWVVVEGVDDADLAKGPGHFPHTALPGQIGNFAVAGHRATHGEPFAHLDQVQVGDQIVVETGKHWLVYQVTWNRILAPSAVEVIEPVAGHPGLKPSARTLTLVTCNPRWSSSERLVVGASLVQRRSADAGPPEILS